MFVAGACVPFRDRDTSEEQVRAQFAPDFVRARQRRRSRPITGRGPDEDRHGSGRHLVTQPRAKVDLRVLADRAVHDGGHLQLREGASEVLGWVHRGQERERTLLGIAIGLVVDVVEHQAVDPHGPQTLEGCGGDLPDLRWFRRQARWGHGEQQELTGAIDDAPLQVHARKPSGWSGRPGPTLSGPTWHGLTRRDATRGHGFVADRGGRGWPCGRLTSTASPKG